MLECTSIKECVVFNKRIYSSKVLLLLFTLIWEEKKEEIKLEKLGEEQGFVGFPC